MEAPAAGLLVVLLALAHGSVGVFVGRVLRVGIRVRVGIRLPVAVRIHLVAALGIAGLAGVVIVGLLGARLVLGVVRVFCVLVGQVQVLDHAPGERRELVLIVHGAHELRGVLGAFVVEPRPPQVGHVAGGLRQVPAGELLAHDHGERLGNRHLLGHGAVIVALAAASLLEGGIEVGRDAGQPFRPQRLDPRLLDGVEDCARGLAARLLAHVGALVVVAEPQRQRVGRAAHQLHVERVEIACRKRKLDLIARDLRLVRAEGDLQLLARLARDRPERRADGPLEGLDRGFLFGPPDVLRLRRSPAAAPRIPAAPCPGSAGNTRR